VVKCHQTLASIAGCFDLRGERDQAFRDDADVVAQALGDDVEVAARSDSLFPNFCANGSKFFLNLSIHIAPTSNNPTIVVRAIAVSFSKRRHRRRENSQWAMPQSRQKPQRTALRLRSRSRTLRSDNSVRPESFVSDCGSLCPERVSSRGVQKKVGPMFQTPHRIRVRLV